MFCYMRICFAQNIRFEYMRRVRFLMKTAENEKI